MEPRPVYFDHNATTPLAADVKALIPRLVEDFGNPSSIHWAGRPAKSLLRDSRRTLSQLLNCDPLELVFTSGGSEANNTAIQGLFNAIETGWGWAGKAQWPSDRNELVISSVEHPSIMKAAEFLARRGYRVHVIPVDANCGIDRRMYEAVVSERCALVSMMFANNETGYVLPIRELCQIAQQKGALFHCDAVQGLGKALIDLRGLGVDMASFSGHKFYALKGCGVLYLKRGVYLESLIHGGGQERGRRAGTENILGIASLGQMAAKAGVIGIHIKKMNQLRDRLEAAVMASLDGVEIVGDALPRICNTSNFIIDGVDGEMLLMNLDVQGFAVSTGAACSSGNPEPSPVLLAMGLSREQAQGSLRISLGWDNSVSEVDRFVEVLTATVKRLRGFRDAQGFANV